MNPRLYLVLPISPPRGTADFVEAANGAHAARKYARKWHPDILAAIGNFPKLVWLSTKGGNGRFVISAGGHTGPSVTGRVVAFPQDRTCCVEHYMSVWRPDRYCPHHQGARP